MYDFCFRDIAILVPLRVGNWDTFTVEERPDLVFGHFLVFVLVLFNSRKKPDKPFTFLVRPSILKHLLYVLLFFLVAPAAKIEIQANNVSSGFALPNFHPAMPDHVAAEQAIAKNGICVIIAFSHSDVVTVESSGFDCLNLYPGGILQASTSEAYPSSVV